MKNKFSNFLRKYWLCFLLSVIMVLGVILSTHYADLYETGSDSDMIRFDLRELYLIYVMPLYSLVYGCLSYAVLKKVWIPQLILFAIGFIYWFRYGIEALVWEGTYIFSAVPVVFSLIGTGIAIFVCYIIQSVKGKQN